MALSQEQIQQIRSAAGLNQLSPGSSTPSKSLSDRFNEDFPVSNIVDPLATPGYRTKENRKELLNKNDVFGNGVIGNTLRKMSNFGDDVANTINDFTGVGDLAVKGYQAMTGLDPENKFAPSKEQTKIAALKAGSTAAAVGTLGASAIPAAGLGLASGYSQDVANNLEERATGTDAAMPGVGSALGAVSALPVGKIISKGKDFLKGDGKAKFDEIANIIGGKITPTSAESLVTKQPGGVFGKFKNEIIDYSNDPKMISAVEAVKDIIKPSRTAGANKNAVLSKIKEVSNNVIRPFLKDNPVPFNFQDLRDSFNLVKPTSYLGDNAGAMTTYNRVKEELLTTMADSMRSTGKTTNSTDFGDFWDALIKVDQKIKREFDGAMELGENHFAGAKAAVQDFRDQARAFTDKSLEFPGQMEQINKMEEFIKVSRSRGIDISTEKEFMDAVRYQFGISNTLQDEARKAFFRENMNKLSDMYYAANGLSTNLKKDMTKNYPKLKAVAQYGLGTVVGGAAVALGTSLVK